MNDEINLEEIDDFLVIMETETGRINFQTDIRDEFVTNEECNMQFRNQNKAQNN